MLLLSSEAHADLVRWAQAGYPQETCGLLIGWVENGSIHVRRALQARNLAARAGVRFDLDPGDHVAAEREAHAHGLAIVGVWHSHPDHPAVPSESDRASAWERWSYLILSVNSGGLDGLRAWRLAQGVFREEEVTGEAEHAS